MSVNLIGKKSGCLIGIRSNCNQMPLISSLSITTREESSSFFSSSFFSSAATFSSFFSFFPPSINGLNITLKL